MVNIGTSLFFAEISGSAVADVAAIGSTRLGASPQSAPTVLFAASFQPIFVFSTYPVATRRARRP